MPWQRRRQSAAKSAARGKPVGIVITACDSAAGAVCPLLRGAGERPPVKLHFAPIAAFLLGVTDIVVPWQTLLPSTFWFPRRMP